MIYALIKNGAVSVYPYTISQFTNENPNVSLPAEPTNQQLNEVGIYQVVATAKPAYNTITQNCTEGTPALTDGIWRQVWVVTDATPDQIAAREAQSKQANKQRASDLLSQTDWTTIPDVSTYGVSIPYLGNASAFASYRNQVRQIAINPPVTVSYWPTMPTEEWLYEPPLPPEPPVPPEPTQ